LDGYLGDFLIRRGLAGQALDLHHRSWGNSVAVVETQAGQI
jgi:hypothetical protein